MMKVLRWIKHANDAIGERRLFFFSSSMRAFSFLYFNDRWFIYKFNKDNIIIIFKKKEKIRIKKNKKE